MLTRRALSQTLLASLFCLAAGLSFAACGDDGGDDDGGTSNEMPTSNTPASNTPASNTPASNTPTSNTSDSDGAYEGPAMLQDTSYRVTTLALTKPAEQASLLTGLVQQGIEDGELNVIIRLTEYSAATPPAMLKIQGDAAKDNGDGTFSWDDMAAAEKVDGNLDENGNFTASMSLSVLNFPIVLGDDMPPIYLPLRNIAFSGRLTGEDMITAGVLTGAITLTDAESVIVPLGAGLPLSMVLGPDTVDTDTDGDGTNDGWSLEGTLGATATTFQ